MSFSCNTTDTLPHIVKVDEKRLRQILINLLSNAIKYTSQGEVIFDISYKNQVAEFTIKDTGSGISSEHQEHIFEPFERIRNSDTPNVPGTGLGLTIVKLLTEIMGGEIKVESQIGKGSCFTVLLMLPWQETIDNKPNRQQVIGYQGEARTVCLVDDDPILRGFISDLLIPLGFTTLEAHNAEACLSMLKKSQPDLFLLDVSMPGKDGFELAQEIRALNIPSPILMLSANAQVPEKNNQQPFNDYLVKPISNHALLDKIGEQLKLQWIELKDTPIMDEVKTEIKPPNNKTIPNHGLIRELKAYAEMGFHKGVMNTIKQLDEQNIIDSELKVYFEQLCKNFMFEQLSKDLEHPEE